MKRINRRGLRGSPRGTPLWLRKEEEKASLERTEKERDERSEKMTSASWGGNPISWSLEARRDLSTRSNAFLKSTKQTNSFFFVESR